MPLTEHPSDHPLKIQAWSPGEIKINDQRYTENILLTVDFQVLPWDGIDYEVLLQGKPELVLLGTGEIQSFLPPALMALFYAQGIGVEVMTTAAAVRTYTVLTSEDRRVSAGLIIKGEKHEV
jgi:uncharacterized protein